jgi:hypothetical protein
VEDRSIVECADKALRTFRCVLEEVVRDAFEICGGFFGPPQFH